MPCKYTSDNYHKNCPARMSDGRALTDYRSSCTMNNMIRANNSITNSFEYRLFLTRNAAAIREMNELTNEQKMACPGYDGSLMPDRTVLRCTPESCSTEEVDSKGVGQRRDFGVGAGCDTLENVSNLRNRVYKRKDDDKNCCGMSWQSSGGYPYIENNLTISPRTPIGGL